MKASPELLEKLYTTMTRIRRFDERVVDLFTAGLVNPRTLAPLDAATILTSVEKTGRLVIAHEGCRQAGFGAEVSAIVAEQAIDCLDAPIVRVAARHSPMPYNDGLEGAVIPSRQDVVAAVRRVCYANGG